MRSKTVWITVIAFIGIIGAGFYFRDHLLSLVGWQTDSAANAQQPGGRFDLASLTTTSIRPAAESTQVSASGNIALSSQRPVVLEADGIVT
ncbi:MAG: hypothetical protein JSV81_03495, partial [Anaerolineales bacterium]